MASGNGRLNDLEHNKVVNGTWTGDYTVGTGGHLLLIMSYNSFLYTGVFIATVHIQPTLATYWPNICTIGPALIRHRSLRGVISSLTLYDPLKVTVPASTLYVGSMLLQCWASVCDAGSTLNQHRSNILYLLGWYVFTDGRVTYIRGQSRRGSTGFQHVSWAQLTL